MLYAALPWPLLTLYERFLLLFILLNFIEDLVPPILVFFLFFSGFQIAPVFILAIALSLIIYPHYLATKKEPYGLSLSERRIACPVCLEVER